MAARTLSPEQRQKKRQRDRERLAKKRAQAEEIKAQAEKKAKKRERDRRYREKKKVERESAKAEAGKKKQKPRKKKAKTEEQKQADKKAKARKRSRKYREALKKRQQEQPVAFLVKDKLWFLFRETFRQKLDPCKFRVVISKAGEVSARLTVLNRELNFYDINEWAADPLTYDELLKQGFLQGFAAFLEMSPDGQLITSPPRASRASAGGVYRHHAETWWYDLLDNLGQVARCMGTAEQMVQNVEESSKGGLGKDTFGINYYWNADRVRPERDKFGLWK